MSARGRDQSKIVSFPLKFEEPAQSSGPREPSAVEGPARVPRAEKADAAVVVADGRPTGVLTRQDVLAYLSS